MVDVTDEGKNLRIEAAITVDLFLIRTYSCISFCHVIQIPQQPEVLNAYAD